MKVSIEILPEAKEPYAVIYTDEVSDEIRRIADMFGSGDAPVTARRGEKTVVLSHRDVYMVRVENGDTVIYGETERYYSRKRLYELAAQLGGQFMQIPKGVLVNLSYLDSVETGFSGAMLLKLKNGCGDYVSRKYLPNFKRYLGL